VHIALFSDFHPDTLGGAQTALRALCDGLRRAGHRTTVFCAPAPGSAPSAPSGDLIPLRAQRMSMSGGLPIVLPTGANRRLIDSAFAGRGPVDVVHALTTYGCGIAGVRAARRHRVPLVQTLQSRDDIVIEKYSPAPYLSALTMRLVHGRYLRGPAAARADGDGPAARMAWRPLLAHAAAADRVVAPSRHFADRLARRGVVTPIEVVSNGIADGLLDEVRGEPAVPAGSGPLRMVWCGRLSAEKRPLAAIDLVRLVSGCTLDLYGSGPQLDPARALIARHGLAERARLHGAVTQADCLRAMRAADLLLLTSDCDTQGMVLLEAVAMGLPVLYCDPDLSETLPVGGVCTGASVEALATALGELVRDRSRIQALRADLAPRRDEPRQSRHLHRMLAVYERARREPHPRAG
jgi:1,2-diacylglycerol 3-alpha-glucosyltransferase